MKTLKHYCFIAAMLLPLWSQAQAMDPAFQRIKIANHPEIEVILWCRDTAGLDQSDWIQLEIKNKSAQEMVLLDASYAIDQVDEFPGTKPYLNHGKYGQANKCDLFHFYYDLQNAPNTGIPLAPKQNLLSWKYMANYASVLLPSRDPGSRICPLFRFELTYQISGKVKKVSNPGAPFCFFWKNRAEIPAAKLASRLLDAIQDVHFRWVHTYIIGTLAEDSSAVALLSTDDLIEGVVKRENVMTDAENLSLLKVLKARNVFPHPALTSFYQKQIQGNSRLYISQLGYYWDNALLDDLLHDKINPWAQFQPLEINAQYWSASAENRSKVYNALSEITFFESLQSPEPEQLKNWSKAVKALSISRDKAFIDYMVPFLEREETFQVEDWSKYKHYGMRPANAHPDTLQVRVCDIAFICLLRAIDQTYFEPKNQINNPFGGIYFKQDYLESTPDHRMIPNEPIDITLHLAEKYIKMTPYGKTKLVAYIQSMK